MEAVVEWLGKGNYVWRGSCEEYQVPDAEKTGLWGGTEVTSQVSSYSAVIHATSWGFIAARVDSDVRVLSDASLPSLLLMPQSPGYYLLLKQPPPPAWLLMRLSVHMEFVT